MGQLYNSKFCPRLHAEEEAAAGEQLLWAVVGMVSSGNAAAAAI